MRLAEEASTESLQRIFLALTQTLSPGQLRIVAKFMAARKQHEELRESKIFVRLDEIQVPVSKY